MSEDDKDRSLTALLTLALWIYGFVAVTRTVSHLSRIADALERAYPEEPR